MSDRHRQVDRRLRQSHTPRRLQNHMHNCKKDDIHRTSSSLWPVGIAYKRKTIYTERLQAFGPWGSHTKEYSSRRHPGTPLQCHLPAKRLP
ncbi:uncharacterized protein LOC115331324 isoform X3 [Ixodes scapularis]|uniref:uncharacterized protein LOC115331324 isoform X3 n=1 Tax=Ixodes scapularis TaxID=6945 RepID=UPI001C389B1C|nr:uncharacterized protein LOC115331324 isoform X3 [Ixodes scapularis]